jgi:hypothetical protein
VKRRHNPTFAEEREIARRIDLKLAASTQQLMLEFDVSRTVITRITRECKVRFQRMKDAREGEAASATLRGCHASR